MFALAAYPAASAAQPPKPVFASAPVAAAPLTWQFAAMRPERDREAILLDAFNEAAALSQAGGLIKFIWRNPGHPLAEKARRLLAEGSYSPARKTRAEWFDSKIVEFDAARRAGPGSLREFMARHPGHPLAAEARRWLP